MCCVVPEALVVVSVSKIATRLAIVSLPIVLICQCWPSTPTSTASHTRLSVHGNRRKISFERHANRPNASLRSLRRQQCAPSERCFPSCSPSATRMAKAEVDRLPTQTFEHSYSAHNAVCRTNIGGSRDLNDLLLYSLSEYASDVCQSAGSASRQVGTRLYYSAAVLRSRTSPQRQRVVRQSLVYASHLYIVEPHIISL